ncbi:hypothetical protein PAXRUDRAFT_167278 [Paxillus rubicundulus Ve08.2h10]|uniref:Uncharacterized protein n=1 Tax=Paxillus rubicundulus Ve08.2h10 TaxID=930991 RepID=A0A0D0D9Y9_9AGAM|nr:hypothetical protein PAXRUDRAFT_167278 [Paxillus rubicundulus Ve08.2h10]
MPTQTHGDAVHDPGSHTNSPGNETKEPPDKIHIQLKGERNGLLSLNVKLTNVKTNTKLDDNESKPPRDPVGMPDGQECQGHQVEGAEMS